MFGWSKEYRQYRNSEFGMEKKRPADSSTYKLLEPCSTVAAASCITCHVKSIFQQLCSRSYTGSLWKDFLVRLAAVGCKACLNYFCIVWFVQRQPHRSISSLDELFRTFRQLVSGRTMICDRSARLKLECWVMQLHAGIDRHY